MNITELNISEMNDLELRGALHFFIEKVKSRMQLEQLAELIKPIIQHNEDDESDWWDELTAEQQADLVTSIGETEDPKKLTSHEEVMKMSKQWLSE